MAYREGTISVTNGSATVTGTGTNFSAVDVGKPLKTDDWSQLGEILTVVSATELTLRNGWGGPTGSGKNYEIGTSTFIAQPYNKLMQLLGWFEKVFDGITAVSTVLKVNRATNTDAAIVEMQTGGSGRMRTRLKSGSDDGVIEVSDDGAAWNESLSMDAATGAVSFPSGAAGLLNISGTPAAGEFARFTGASGLEGRTVIQVRGDLGIAATVATKSANYTAVAADRGKLIRFTGAYTLNLTAAATLGADWICDILADGGDVTIDPDGAETVNGTATATISNGGSGTLYCTGGAFFLLTAGAGQSGEAVPVGAFLYFSMDTPPTGWLVADGSAVSRTVYSALFTEIQDVFGPGDGSTTFNLPDARGEKIRGWDNGRGVDAGRVFGSAQAHSTEDLYAAIAGAANYIAEKRNDGVSFSPSQRWVSIGGGYENYSVTQNRAVRVETVGSGETTGRNIALLPCIKY